MTTETGRVLRLGIVAAAATGLAAVATPETGQGLALVGSFVIVLAYAAVDLCCAYAATRAADEDRQKRDAERKAAVESQRNAELEMRKVATVARIIETLASQKFANNKESEQICGIYIRQIAQDCLRPTPETSAGEGPYEKPMPLPEESK